MYGNDMESMAAYGVAWPGQPTPTGLYADESYGASPAAAGLAVMQAPGMIGDLSPVYVLLALGALFVGMRLLIEHGASLSSP